jgi:hypothetical protein
MPRSPKLTWLFHLAIAALIFALPGLRLGAPAWQMTTPLKIVFGGLAIGYLVSMAFTALRPSARWLDAPLTVLAIFGGLAIGFLTVDYQFPRAAFLAAVVVGLLAATLATTLPRLLNVLAILATITAAVVLVLPAKTRVVIRPAAPSTRTVESITTAFYPLDVVRYKNAVPAGRKFTAFGSILEWGDGYLVATGDGDLYSVKLPADRPAEATKLPTQVPLNIEDFDKASGSSKSGQFFRLMDVRLQNRNGKLRVFASHHWWNTEHNCAVVRVSELETTPAEFAAASLNDRWKTIYQSTPCLPLAGTDWPFSGMEGGGRIRQMDDSTLLLTIGDHGFNGVVYNPDYVSDRAASYGKTWKIHLESARAPELFTIGHRNPQGLFVDPDGSVWETEHGAQGGDELNLLRAGVDYGWPHVTYGTNYGKFTWPRNPAQGRHEGYTLPAYAWIPSIGTSNLIRIEKDLFPVWKGDLMVSSLNAGELFRVRTDSGRAVFAEPIVFGERIRDLIEDHLGRLVLWTDTRSIIVVQPGKMPELKETPPATVTGAVP